MSSKSLQLLLVEDEALIAMMAEDLVETLGHTVSITVATLDEARDICAHGSFDAALLDVNLNGDSSMELATLLAGRGCPFAFTTGYGAGGVAAEHSTRPVLTKPYSLTDLETVLDDFAHQLAGSISMISSVDSNRG